MATLERDIVFMGRSSGKQTMDFPITKLKNVEGTAEVKTELTDSDQLPVMDAGDSGQMKKVGLGTLRTAMVSSDVATKSYVNSQVAEAKDMSFQYGTSTTAGATVAKIATLSGFTLKTGALVIIRFTYENTASNATLNVNYTGAKAIRVGGSAMEPHRILAGMCAIFRYDGSYWQLLNPAEEKAIKAQAEAKALDYYEWREIYISSDPPDTIPNGKIFMLTG